jgi:hypothetical protein
VRASRFRSGIFVWRHVLHMGLALDRLPTPFSAGRSGCRCALFRVHCGWARFVYDRNPHAPLASWPCRMGVLACTWQPVASGPRGSVGKLARTHRQAGRVPAGRRPVSVHHVCDPVPELKTQFRNWLRARGLLLYHCPFWIISLFTELVWDGHMSAASADAVQGAFLQW